MCVKDREGDMCVCVCVCKREREREKERERVEKCHSTSHFCEVEWRSFQQVCM